MTSFLLGMVAGAVAMILLYLAIKFTSVVLDFIGELFW